MLTLAQYPSCVIPFGKVGEPDAQATFELKEDQTAPPCECSTPIHVDVTFANIQNLTDNFEQLEGAPCSIQVFTTTLRDEECLQMTKQIDQCLKGTV